MADLSIKTIISTLQELHPFSEELSIGENLDEPLTGQLFGLSKIDLVYLFFELEKKLGITFEEQMLDEYGFSTINNISEAIDYAIGKKEPSVH